MGRPRPARRGPRAGAARPGAGQAPGLRRGPAAPTLDGSSPSATKPGATLEPGVRAALRLGLFQLVFLDGIAAHAAVTEAVELAKPIAPGHRLVNAVLRRVARDGVELPADDDPAGAAVRHSHPEWLVRRWWEELGPETTRGAPGRRQRARPSSALRINTLVADEPAPRAWTRPPARPTPSSWTARPTCEAHPGWTPGRLHRPVARRPARRPRRRPAAGRARPRPLRGARRQDDAPRRAHGRRGRGRRRRAPRRPGARAARAPCARLRATSVDGRARPTRPRSPAAARSTASSSTRPAAASARCAAPRPALARLERRRSAPRRRCRTTCSRPPAARARAGGGRPGLLRLHDLGRARSGCRGRDRTGRTLPHRDATDGLLHCRSRCEELDLGLRVPGVPRAVAAPLEPRGPLPLRELPAPLRAALGVPGLRRALHDRAHVEHRDHRLQPLRRLHAPRGLTPPHRPVHPGRRLRPPARAGRRRSSPPARACIHVDVMDGHFVPPLTMGPSACEALRGLGADLDVHLMVERPERHVEAFAEAGADDDHRPRRGHAARRLRRCAASARPAAARRWRSTRRPRSTSCAEVATSSTSSLCMTVNPGWGGQAFIPASLDKLAPAARAARRRRSSSRSTAGSTRRRPARARRPARRCSWPARRSSGTTTRRPRCTASAPPRARCRRQRVRLRTTTPR